MALAGTTVHHLVDLAGVGSHNAKVLVEQLLLVFENNPILKLQTLEEVVFAQRFDSGILDVLIQLVGRKASTPALRQELVDHGQNKENQHGRPWVQICQTVSDIVAVINHGVHVLQLVDFVLEHLSVAVDPEPNSSIECGQQLGVGDEGFVDLICDTDGLSVHVSQLELTNHIVEYQSKEADREQDGYSRSKKEAYNDDHAQVRVLPFEEEHITGIILKVLPDRVAHGLVLKMREPFQFAAFALICSHIGIQEAVIHCNLHEWVNRIEDYGRDEDVPDDGVPLNCKVTVLAVEHFHDWPHEV